MAACKFNYFTFETLMKKRISELVEPVLTQQAEDKKVMDDISKMFKSHHKRMSWIEAIFDESVSKNPFFDKVMEKLCNSDVERLQFAKQIQNSINNLQDKMDKVEDHSATVDISLDKHSKQINNNFKMIEESRVFADENQKIIQSRIEDLMKESS